MEVRAGYKRITGLGVIPVDWEAKKLSTIANVKTGPFGSSLHERDYVDDGTPIITVEHLGELGVIHENLPMVSDFDRERLNTYELLSGDIVFSRVGSVDRNSLISERENGWLFSGRLLRIRVNNKNILPAYLSYYFSQEPTKQRIRSVAVGQTMASLNTRILSEVEVAHPPTRVEQTAIATALSDADALINSLEKLIAKKRNIKQGAMQQLLTGEKRLPGFSGKWQPLTLKGVAALQAGINKPVSQMGRGALYVTVQDIYSGTSISTENLGRIQVTAEELAAKSLKPGDIVFGKSSVKRDGIGYPSQFLGCAEPAVFSGFTFCARARAGVADSVFLFYMLRWEKTRRWLIENSQTSALTNINQRIAERIPLTLPELHEQIAIAQVLRDMDSEIDALERKLGKYRLIKQGMMQELLTGQKRLI